MTIKEIALKYGIEYHVIYQAMIEAGLVRYGKNRQYSEREVIAAVCSFVLDRANRHMRETDKYLDMGKRIAATIENEGQKQGK